MIGWLLAIVNFIFKILVRVSAHRHFVFLQNFVKSSLGRIFAKDLRFCEQLLRKIKVNTIAEEGRTWKKGSKSSPLLCNFLRQIQFLNFKIWTSQEACCLSYHFFKYKPNFTKFCTDTKPVSANSLRVDLKSSSSQTSEKINQMPNFVLHTYNTRIFKRNGEPFGVNCAWLRKALSEFFSRTELYFIICNHHSPIRSPIFLLPVD